MFRYIKSVFAEASIRNRIIFVLFILALTRVLSAIPIPSISGELVSKFVNNNAFLSTLNMFTGGGLSTFSIVMLGVQPYITASIITQLLTVLSPKIKAMQKEEGEAGRRRFNQYTRWLSMPLSLLQAYGLLTLFVKSGVVESMTHTQMLFNIIVITAGSMLMMWLGEIINEKGVGNGVSLIIFAGIIANLPHKMITDMATATTAQIPLYIALAVTFLLVLFGVVYVTEAERPLEVTYAKQARDYSSNIYTSSYIPLRLTMAGVIPIIFALSLLMFPQILAQLLATSSSATAQAFAGTMVNFLNNTWIYGFFYFVLIVMFTFFYTSVTFDIHKTAEDLQKSGAFIPGHRPGESTTKYMGDVLTRVTFVGAIFLGLVALLPIILGAVTGIKNIQFGGTSLLIAVSVIIDLIKKIDAQLTMREY
ncbi:MAG: preprotein translocase subunit SecY [Patescibacteria group bacterium]|nr:preprotein translocase subunit SecY [Patescibacteria group bacterium]